MANQPRTLFVGAEFSDFDSLKLALSTWEKENFVNLYTRCSRSLDAGKKRAPKKSFNEKLKYFSIDYACVHGGRTYKQHLKTGTRPRQMTLLKECPFGIRVRTSSDCQNLVVTKIDAPESHSHELNKEVFLFSAKQRKLSITEAEQVKDMLNLKANKKLMQNHNSLSTDPKITVKDLHNLLDPKQNDFAELVTDMKKVEEDGCFDHSATCLLIEAVSEQTKLLSPQLKGKLYEEVQKQMEAAGYSISVDKIRRKWSNLVVTYKRVKDRVGHNGFRKVRWEYYKLIDNILGDSFEVQATPEICKTPMLVTQLKTFGPPIAPKPSPLSDMTPELPSPDSSSPNPSPIPADICSVEIHTPAPSPPPFVPNTSQETQPKSQNLLTHECLSSIPTTKRPKRQHSSSSVKTKMELLTQLSLDGEEDMKMLWKRNSKEEEWEERKILALEGIRRTLQENHLEEMEQRERHHHELMQQMAKNEKLLLALQANKT